jgi:hypothetical protein
MNFQKRLRDTTLIGKHGRVSAGAGDALGREKRQGKGNPFGSRTKHG